MGLSDHGGDCLLGLPLLAIPRSIRRLATIGGLALDQAPGENVDLSCQLVPATPTHWLSLSGDRP